MTETRPARLAELLHGPLLIERLGATLPGLLYVYDLIERRNVYANRAMAELLGYSAEQVQALDPLLATIIHPDDVAATAEHHARMPSVADGQVVEIEYRVRAADGSFRWLHSWETVLSRDSAGRPQQLLGIAQDVTRRAEMEEELRESQRKLAESEQRWRSIAENPFDFVIVIDRDYKYTYVNFVEGGLKEEDLIGKATPFDFVASSDHAVMQAAFDVAFEEGRATSYEVYVPAFDKWYSSLVGPIREGDVVTHASVLTREITNEKRMQQQARQADEQLRVMEAKLAQSAKLEAVGQLAGGIAHDFNNLLTGIGGVADLLGSRLGRDDPNYRDVAELQLAVQRGAGLTRQLLAFSRQQPVAPTVVDLSALVVETGRMLRRLIGEGIELELSEASRALSVRCDRTQLEQVIINLAVNARDAMPKGGRLRITLDSVALDASAHDLHTDARPGRFVRLLVTDTGIGMDSATLARIFEPFFTTKPIGAGTGLGLSMAYGIVRQSGGFILVSSELGRGTSFQIHLPQVEPAEAQAVEPRATRTGGTETILLVEDEEMVRRFTRRLLEALGYRVLVAERGDQALELLHTGIEPDLLLTDVLLPGLDGHELYQQARRLRPNLPVVFTSGYTDDVFAGKVLSEARASFLQKPFTHDELAATVRARLDA